MHVPSVSAFNVSFLLVFVCFKDHAYDKTTELRWGNLRGGCRDSQTVSYHQDHVGRYIF